MKANAMVDSIRQLDRFHFLVHRQQDAAQGIQEKLLFPDDTVLMGLRTETQELLTEIARLLTNAPVELHARFGNRVFEDITRTLGIPVTSDVANVSSTTRSWFTRPTNARAAATCLP